jgi:H+/Cl- antiporter ClcA
MSESRWDVREHAALGAYALKWTAYCAALAAVVGSSVAWFLILLDRATSARFAHPRLLYALPLAGAAVAVLYHLGGKDAERGNNLIVDEIHEPGAGVPARMAPLVFLGTVATHLCGGSAGREGTAVQMGGSLAALLARTLRLSPEDRRTMLMAGVAGGFGAVFGTPLAGAVFAMEVLAIGSLRYDAVLPCLMSALLSDWVCRTLWSVRHSDYHMSSIASAAGGGVLILKVALAGVCFGLAGSLFAWLAHRCQALFRRIAHPALRPVAGAAVVIAMVHLLGTREYLGLGVASPDPRDVTIFSSFVPGGAHALSWLWKSVFTAVTLGSGFKGGEVTPLFFVGASLGNALSGPFAAPASLFAALGFVAVFAGAANTPLACTIMGVELFGAEHVVPLAVACFVAYLFSGHAGVYSAQRVAAPKPGKISVA